MANQQPQTQIMRIDARNTHQDWGLRDFERIGDQITGLHGSGANIVLVGPEADFELWEAVLPSGSLEPISLTGGKEGRIGLWTDELEATRRQFKAGGMVYAQRENQNTGRLNTLAGHLASRVAQSSFVGRTSLSFLFETDGLGVNMRSYDLLDRYRRSILSGARIALESGAFANCADRHNSDIATTFSLQRMRHSNGSFSNAVLSRKLGI